MPYVQCYRKGIIEAVEGLLLKPVIPSLTFEMELLKAVDSYLNVLKTLGVSAPVNMRLALLGVKGFRMGVENVYDPRTRVREIERDNVVLPDGMIDDLNVKAQDIMRPFFDFIWNACGYPKSPYFNDEGQWIGKRV